MRKELIDHLRQITPEEQEILNNGEGIRQALYTSGSEFIIDSQRLLEKGRLIEIRPHTRFADFPRHRHNYVEMIYVCQGEVTHVINGRDRLTMKEGDLLFLSQNAFHEILPAGESDIAVNFIILPEFFDRPVSMIERENVLRDFLISSLSGANYRFDYLHIPTKGILPVENLMEALIWTLVDKKARTNTIIQTSMGLLMMYLSAFAEKISMSDSNSYEQNLVLSVLKYVETHYKSGTLQDIASEVGRPTYFISRLLKKHTGLNFKELLQNRKLQQAAYLAANTTLSVEAIRETIGYDNNSYFYRIFREKYHCSPNEYRNASSANPVMTPYGDLSGQIGVSFPEKEGKNA